MSINSAESSLAFDRIQTFSSNAIRQKPENSFTQQVCEKYDIKNPEQLFLAKLHSEGFSMEELEDILTCKTSQLSLAIAGSGKSTALNFKIMYDMISGKSMRMESTQGGIQVPVPDKIWVSTFLKSGVEEMPVNIAKWQKKFNYLVNVDGITFSTLHAEFKRVLEAMGVSVKMCSQDFNDASNSSNILKKVVKKMGILPVQREVMTLDDYQKIEGIVTNYRNRLDSTRYDDSRISDYMLPPMLLDALVEQYAQARRELGLMDFEDLQEILYKYLYIVPNPNVQDFIANRYRHIYIDEFQDTSQIQYAILRFYARDSLVFNQKSLADYDVSKFGEIPTGLYKPFENLNSTIFVVGDDDQSIYGWRGSDIRIILNRFEGDFSPKVSSLSYNYRCPSVILDAVKPSIEKNTMRHKKKLNAFKQGGECLIRLSNNQFDLLRHMHESIKKDIADGMSVAVLCRTNYDGSLPAVYMQMCETISFSVSGANMTLDNTLPRKLLSMTSLFTEGSTPNVKRALEVFAPYGKTWEVAELVKVLKNNSKTIWSISLDDVAYSCGSLLSILKMLRDIVLDEEGKRQPQKEIEALKHIYTWMYEYAFKGDSIYCISARTYIQMLLFVLTERKFSSIFDFQEYMNVVGDGLKARIKKSGVEVTIATVHEFKGKERDSVYIWNDSVDVFPTSKCDIGNQDQLEEERRVHYIACTRAKKKQTVYASSSQLGMFARELDCPKVELTASISGSLGSSTKTGEMPLGF